MNQHRSTTAEAYAAGLAALRAKGLEPSGFAKDLAERVIKGEITSREMEERLLQHYREQDARKTELLG